MRFCQLLDSSGPLGPYGIVLSKKARESLAKRDLTLFLIHRVNWVEDGVRNVIDQMLSSGGRVADYLRVAYPETFAENQRKTETDDTRRTLLFRLRYLLRCMMVLSSHYESFDPQFSISLKSSLDIFTECVRQAVGEKVAVRLAKSTARFFGVWETVSSVLTDEESVVRELRFLIDDLDEVFEVLREAFRAKELERERGRIAAERTAEALEQLGAAQEESNRLQRAGLRRCAELSAAKNIEEGDDAYSSMAGLAGLSAAKRRELVACFRYSHERFAVDRKAKSGGHSFRQLANVVWRDHASEFAALARLRVEPGYKDARSLGIKLAKLAARYPAADHFRWRA